MLSDLINEIKTYLDALYPEANITVETIQSEIEGAIDTVYKLTGTTSVDIPIDWYTDGSPPYAVEQYIKFQVLYDNAYRKYISSVADSGKQEALGDYSYQVQSGGAKDFRALLDDLKDKLNYWLNIVMGLYAVENPVGLKFARPQSVVRGESYEDYPFTSRGSAW